MYSNFGLLEVICSPVGVCEDIYSHFGILEVIRSLDSSM